MNNLVLPQQLHQGDRDQPPLFLNFLYCGEMSWKISEGSTGLALSELGEKAGKSLTRISSPSLVQFWSGGLGTLSLQQPLLRSHFYSHSPISPGSVQWPGELGPQLEDKAVRGTEKRHLSTHQHYLGTLPGNGGETARGRWEKIHWQGIPRPWGPHPHHAPYRASRPQSALQTPLRP